MFLWLVRVRPEYCCSNWYPTFKNQFVQPVRVNKEDGESYVAICLTANGNEA